MKIAFLLPIVLLPSSILAEVTTVANNALSVTTGEHREHLISGIVDLNREQPQLRRERRMGAGMFGGKNSGDRGGSRLSFQKEGGEEVAVWNVVEADSDKAVLESSNAGLTAVLTMEGEATAARLVLQWSKESPFNESPLHWKWMLEVGGDFFAVPTEGVADHQVYLTQDKDGGRRMQFSPIQRMSEQSFALIEPWWAVADRNQGTILVCRLSGGTGMPKISQWSGNQGSADAFEQTIVLEPGEAGRKIEAKVSLYSGLQSLNGLGKSTAFQFVPQGDTATFHCATESLIEDGQIALFVGEEKIVEWPFSQWAPKEPLVLPLGSLASKVPNDLKHCWLKLEPRGGIAEKIELYQGGAL